MNGKQRFILAGFVALCLALVFGLLFQKEGEPPSPRVQFIGFTNQSGGLPQARFSVTNQAAVPLFVGLAGRWDDGGIDRPAMNGKKQIETRFVSPPLPAGGFTNFSLAVPSTNVVWFVEVNSGPPPTRMKTVLMRLSRLLAKIGIETWWGYTTFRRSEEKTVVPMYPEPPSN